MELYTAQKQKNLNTVAGWHAEFGGRGGLKGVPVEDPGFIGKGDITHEEFKDEKKVTIQMK